MNDFMIDIYILYQQKYYTEDGLEVNRTRQLHYTAFDEKMAEAVITSVQHALEDAECSVLNKVKVMRPIKEVINR